MTTMTTSSSIKVKARALIFMWGAFFFRQGTPNQITREKIQRLMSR
jgi:hypothetical protein